MPTISAMIDQSFTEIRVKRAGDTLDNYPAEARDHLRSIAIRLCSLERALDESHHLAKQRRPA